LNDFALSADSPATTTTTTKTKTTETSSKAVIPSDIYNVDLLLERIKSNINYYNIFETFELYLRNNVKHYPIVSRRRTNWSNQFKNMQHHHYAGTSLICAESIHEYYSWPYGKRKSIEWMRALYLKRKCEAQMLRHCYHLTTKFWSTKQVVLWLRSHGYTPMEYSQICRLNKNETALIDLNHSISKNTCYVDSLCPINDLIKSSSIDLNIEINSDLQKNEEDDEIIDVVSIDSKLDEANNNVNKDNNDKLKSNDDESLYNLNNPLIINDIEQCDLIKQELQKVIIFKIY
jgi:hypothetical protein